MMCVKFYKINKAERGKHYQLNQNLGLSLKTIYRLHLASAVLDPLQVDVTKACARHTLQAVHVVLVDLHAKDLRVSLDVVPLGVGLKRLLDGGVLEPAGQFRGLDQVVDNTLEETGEGKEMVDGWCGMREENGEVREGEIEGETADAHEANT